MPKDFGPGNDGTGFGGSTAYPLESAPVVKHGGNTPIQDGIATQQSPTAAMKSDAEEGKTGN